MYRKPAPQPRDIHLERIIDDGTAAVCAIRLKNCVDPIGVLDDTERLADNFVAVAVEYDELCETLRAGAILRFMFEAADGEIAYTVHTQDGDLLGITSFDPDNCCCCVTLSERANTIGLREMLLQKARPKGSGARPGARGENNWRARAAAS